MSLVDAYAGLITAGTTITRWIDRASDFVLVVGPGLTLALGAWLCLWAWDKTAAHRAKRRTIRAERRQQAVDAEQMARLTAAIDNAPLTPTQPGWDQQALDTCWDIWDATQAREEKP